MDTHRWRQWGDFASLYFGMFPTARFAVTAGRGRLRRRWTPLCWLACTALAGCGGGVSIGFGLGDSIDRSPPSVSLAAAPTSVAAGQPVRLIAAAADENGIDVVAFFRLDNGQQQPLGTLGRAPYELTVNAPDDGRTVLTVFARAIDNFGNRADSALVNVAVTH